MLTEMKERKSRELGDLVMLNALDLWPVSGVFLYSSLRSQSTPGYQIEACLATKQ